MPHQYTPHPNPLGKIDKVVMIDHGGSDGGNHSGGGLNRFAQAGPTVIFGLLQQLQALGLNVPEILAQLNGTPANSQANGHTLPAVVPVPGVEVEKGKPENGNPADGTK